MKGIFNRRNVVLAVNGLLIAAIFVLNYFYQSNHFDFTLKCVCSSGFALLGLINLGYALSAKEKNVKFFVAMTAGLVLAMLGDVIINSNFIMGAGAFALGHLCFVTAYCFLKKINWLEFAISGVLFIGAGAFLLFFPLLDFGEPVFRWVCIVYALIISLMFGKATANFIYERNLFNALLAIGSFLFVFSDIMLVFDWFIGLWSWTNEVCMAAYYPALCLLAFAMCFKVGKDAKES